MLSLDRADEALEAFGRIYTTYENFKDLPCNKTVDFSVVCSHIARLKYVKGDMMDSLSFYREAMTHAEGENERKEIEAAIHEIEREMKIEVNSPVPVKKESIKELSHEFDEEE